MEYGSFYGMSSPGFPKRQEGRLPATLKVRVLGMDASGKPFHLPATTTEISASGARITGLEAKLNKGDIVGVQSSGGKNRFKVTWIRVSRDYTYEVGLRCVEKGASPWRDSMKSAGQGADRRSNDRYPCNGTANLRLPSSGAPIRATLRDVSASGCSVQSEKIAAVGQVLSGEFTINNMQMNAIVEVCRSTTKAGTGLLWCDLGSDGKAKLTRVLRDLAADAHKEASGNAQAISHVDRVHQLLMEMREQLEDPQLLVNSDTLEYLHQAQEKLTAALKSVQP